MPPGHLIILLKSNLFNMASVSVKRSNYTLEYAFVNRLMPATPRQREMIMFQETIARKKKKKQICPLTLYSVNWDNYVKYPSSRHGSLLDPFHISERFIKNKNAILASFWYGYSYCYAFSLEFVVIKQLAPLLFI